MASLTLKDLPDDLLERLRRAARRDRRSLAQQVLYLIEGGLAAGERSEGTASSEAEEQVARWRELAGRWTSDQSFDDEVDRIRAARTEGRSVTL
ncbi:hypothetical protein L6R50_06205 [Myxococcota bacterium]|nr:hypothetical protein [Myxococcota bacterium]